MVLDRRLGQVELLGDLGQIQVLAGEQLEDAQARLVAQRPMQSDDRRRRRESIVGFERVVGHRIAEEPPVVAGEQEVVRPAEVGRREHDPADADLRQPADAPGRPLDQVGIAQGAAVDGSQRVVAFDDRRDPRLDRRERRRPGPKDPDDPAVTALRVGEQGREAGLVLRHRLAQRRQRVLVAGRGALDELAEIRVAGKVGQDGSDESGVGMVSTASRNAATVRSSGRSTATAATWTAIAWANTASAASPSSAAIAARASASQVRSDFGEVLG